MKIIAAIELASWVWAFLAIAASRDQQSGIGPAIAVFVSSIVLALAVLVG